MPGTVYARVCLCTCKWLDFHSAFARSLAPLAQEPAYLFIVPLAHICNQRATQQLQKQRNFDSEYTLRENYALQTTCKPIYSSNLREIVYESFQQEICLRDWKFTAAFWTQLEIQEGWCKLEFSRINGNWDMELSTNFQYKEIQA